MFTSLADYDSFTWSRGLAASAVTRWRAVSAPAIASETRAPLARRSIVSIVTKQFPAAQASGLARRSVAALCAVLIMLGMFGHAASAAANPKYAGMVIDATSGEVLYSSNANKQLYPASLTKMMTLYLTFRALEDGRLSLGSTIKFSRNAANEAPSRLGLRAGERIKVEEAIYALVTKSANDVATALGERLGGGSEQGFAEKANIMARQLGMTSSHFRNAHGLPDKHQVSTARDMATLGQALIRDFPQYYHYFSTKSWTFRGTAYRSHNKLMATYEGMDGLKTGYTRAAGYNLVASAKRGDLRLIGVVFGGRSSARRNNHMAVILDRAFTSERGQFLIAHGSVPNIPIPTRRPAPLIQLADATAGGLPADMAPMSLPAPAAAGFSGAGLAPPAGPATPAPETQVASAILPPPGPDRPIPREAEAITLLGAPLAPGRVDRHIFTSDKPIPDDVFGLPLPAMRPGSDGDAQIVNLPPTGTTQPQAAVLPSPAAAGPTSIDDLLASTAFATSPIGPDVSGTWSVQVGAFSRRMDAEQALSNAQARVSKLIRAHRLLVPYGDTGHELYRARLTGLAEREATNACALLASIALDCIIVPPSATAG